jgi:hypothetical protein
MAAAAPDSVVQVVSNVTDVVVESTVVVETVESETTVDNLEVVEVVAPEPTKRGSRKTKVTVTNEVEPVVNEDVAQVKAKRGAAKQKQAVGPVNVPVEPVTEDVAPVKAKRGAAKQKVEVAEPVVAPIETPAVEETSIKATKQKKGVVINESVNTIKEFENEVAIPTISRKRAAAAPKSTAKAPAAKKGKKDVEVVEVEEDTAILCDGCDAEFFLDQVGLTTVPEGDWFCTSCVTKKSKTAKKGSKNVRANETEVGEEKPVVKKGKVVKEAVKEEVEVVTTRKSTRGKK